MARYAKPSPDFYQTLANDFLNHSITLSLVLAGPASSFYHLVLLETLVSDTGGEIYFSPTLDSAYRNQTLTEVHAFLQVLALTPAYRNISGRLRFSTGLTTAAYHGGLATDSNYNTFVTGSMTERSCVIAEMDMERYIKGPYAYAQFAILYVQCYA